MEASAYLAVLQMLHIYQFRKHAFHLARRITLMGRIKYACPRALVTCSIIPRIIHLQFAPRLVNCILEINVLQSVHHQIRIYCSIKRVQHQRITTKMLMAVLWSVRNAMEFIKLILRRALLLRFAWTRALWFYMFWSA